MIGKKWISVFFIFYLALGGLFLHGLVSRLAEPAVDLVAVNRIVHDTAASWDEVNFQKSSDCPYEYTVLDKKERMLYQSDGTAPATVYEAISGHHTVLDVEADGEILGKVLIRTGYDNLTKSIRGKLTASFVFFLVLLLLPAFLFMVYLNRSILRPFQDMQDFARHVAAGNLDFPLPMDQGHAFGAFTESFDLMREQLKEAKLKEAEANRSKKELIASLSHDIKTPVASIKLVSELLLATEPAGKTRDKIGTIYEKAEQINRLVTNLFQASLDDLEKMTVHVSEENSTVLEPFIRSADYYGRVEMDPIPGCILLLDPLRISQVIDNIIHNTYKYAGTTIKVTSSLSADGLVLEFADYGKGVPDEELPYLFQKFYRGSGTQDGKADGSGLGLYISSLLMEEMGGAIRCFNRPDGFSVELCIPFAG